MNGSSQCDPVVQKKKLLMRMRQAPILDLFIVVTHLIQPRFVFGCPWDYREHKKYVPARQKKKKVAK